FNVSELQKLLSSLNFFVPGVINGFIPSNFFVQSSMFMDSFVFGGTVLAGLGLTFSRENANAKRRSSTGGGVFGISFGSRGVVVPEVDRCADFRRAGPVKEN